MAFSTSRPHVLILGAGIGGLTLAQALRKARISFQIFERDSSFNARSQGWAIALHSVLADFAELFSDNMPPLESTSHLLPLTLQPELCFYAGSYKASTIAGSGTKVVRANREKLRAWLATNLNIHFGKEVLGIAETKDGVTLNFLDGSSASGGVLVGADGVNSFVRRHLVGGKDLLKRVLVNDQMISSITGQTQLNRQSYERLMKLAVSAYVVMGENYHIFVGLNCISEDESTARYYWFVNYAQTAQEYQSSATMISKEQLLEFALRKTETLHPKFTEIIRQTRKEDILLPGIVFRDLKLDGIKDGRITLLGDAAHAMAPFRGEGGSHAMKDALNLARVLIDNESSDIPRVLKEYESEMLTRGRAAVEDSRNAFNVPRGGEEPHEAWGQKLEVSVH